MIESTPYHLSNNQIINQGSFYTPEKYVHLAGSWLQEHISRNKYIFLDSSCGYGSFLRLSYSFTDSKFIGNDIDSEAILTAQNTFPEIDFYHKNALMGVRRKQYNISEKDPLIIIGNPPYNDITSQNKQKSKIGVRQDIDDDIKSRDLGISFLNSYEKLKADYVCILHPLSYLIKKANFNSASRFFHNYRIEKNIIFSSSEFANTSKTSFPVAMILYRRHEADGLSFDQVSDIIFKTIEGQSFSLNCWDYLGNYIQKYPSNKRYENEILFYTLRDVNALKRSRTFIKDRIANAIDVAPDKLAYYCYIDCFKRFANPPYYLANFDIPFIQNEFHNISESVKRISQYYHPEIFGEPKTLSQNDVDLVIQYINKVTSLTL